MSPLSSHHALLRWLGLAIAVVVVLGVTIKVWGPTSGDSQKERANVNADAAIRAMRQGDLAELDRRLRGGRADPRFAFRFAKQATPRDLGDTLASAAGVAFGSDREIGAGTERSGMTAAAIAYERALNDLAAVLSLATHGTGDLALPASWAGDFALATTTPEQLYDEVTDDDRAAQDAANKQNLLLLLSRGWWSTQFLMTMTAAFWDWEHEPENARSRFSEAFNLRSVGPWPDREEAHARYAPSPDGTYLTDGMVALLAALTANPEASGWAFAGFKSGTQTVSLGEGENRSIGTFSDYVFFDHAYAPSPDGADSSGVTAAYTALMSAIQVSGGSDAEGALGPARDLRVIQDGQEAAQSDQAENDPEHWYEKIGRAIAGWGHSALDVLGALPIVGEPADVINAIWYGIEDDWASAGLSLAATVPLVGHGAALVKVARAGAKGGVKAGAKAGAKAGGKAAAKSVDLEGREVDLGSEGGRLLADATPLGEGTFDFSDADAFLNALEVPVEGVVYKLGSTRYELGAGRDEPTLLSGPDRGTILRVQSQLADPQAESGRYCVLVVSILHLQRPARSTPSKQRRTWRSHGRRCLPGSPGWQARGSTTASSVNRTAVTARSISPLVRRGRSIRLGSTFALMTGHRQLGRLTARPFR